MLLSLQSYLRKQLWWLRFQELRREGFRAAWVRQQFQKQILSTLPLQTATTGPVEVRVLTWRRDWVNMVWALKSFYHFAQVDYPLHIHDGGLLPWQCEELLKHFPNARIITRAEADQRYPKELTQRGWHRSAEYRQKNVSTRKLFDYVLDSQAESFVTIDSDIVFFQRPDLLLPNGPVTTNRYNRDDGYWYSLSLDELEKAFGIRPPDGINSGLAIIHRESLDLAKVEEFLGYPPLFADPWVTEQTLHALCSTLFGVDLLPDTYRVGGPIGITPDLICKHYPGTHRPLLYSEGMGHLIKTGFLQKLGAK